MLSKLKALLSVFELEGSFLAAIRWKKFSLASFLIVSRIKGHGILPGTVIDLGANVGQFAVAALNLLPGIEIYSVEPDPGTAGKLKRNLSNFDKAIVLNFAISDSDGEAEFNVNKDSQVSSLLSLGKDRISEFPDSIVLNTITVPIKTMDSVFLDAELKPPVLLKIDVQGLEDKVLRGGSKFLRQVTWIIIEVSFSDLYEGESDFRLILDLMNENDFFFVRPLNFHTSPITKQIMEMDALFEKRVHGF